MAAEPQAGVPSYSDGVIVLDGHRVADVGAHLAGEDEETARRFGWWPQRSTEETVLRAFGDWAEQWRTDGPRRAFAVRLAGTGVLVGGCELHRQPDGTGHVSYWTGAAHRGHGYASHALALLRRHAASEGITILHAHVALDNLASRAVAEHAGFGLSTTFRDAGGSAMVCYVWRVPTRWTGPSRGSQPPG